jgi:hypothetical protein
MFAGDNSAPAVFFEYLLGMKRISEKFTGFFVRFATARRQYRRL